MKAALDSLRGPEDLFLSGGSDLLSCLVIRNILILGEESAGNVFEKGLSWSWIVTHGWGYPMILALSKWGNFFPGFVSAFSLKRNFTQNSKDWLQKGLKLHFKQKTLRIARRVLLRDLRHQIINYFTPLFIIFREAIFFASSSTKELLNFASLSVLTSCLEAWCNRSYIWL